MAVMSYGWEGYHRSRVARAMCYRPEWFNSLVSKADEDEHLPMLSKGLGQLLQKIWPESQYMKAFLTEPAVYGGKYLIFFLQKNK